MGYCGIQGAKIIDAFSNFLKKRVVEMLNVCFSFFILTTIGKCIYKIHIYIIYIYIYIYIYMCVCVCVYVCLHIWYNSQLHSRTLPCLKIFFRNVILIWKCQKWSLNRGTLVSATAIYQIKCPFTIQNALFLVFQMLP